MKHNKFLTRWRMLFVAAGLTTLGSVLVVTTSFAQSSTGCRAYAEDYAERYSAGSATPFASGGDPAPLVQWRPAQRVDFASQRLLTMHTHDACKTDGREYRG